MTQYRQILRLHSQGISQWSIPSSRTVWPPTSLPCAKLMSIRSRTGGGVDIQLLGLGHDGHIGFSEPCDHFPVITHEVKLTEMTREANKRFFDSLEDVPTSAITMGIGTVMSARKILMIVTGADKAEILQQVFFGSVKPEVPGSILQFHPDVTVICDEAAARFVEE